VPSPTTSSRDVFINCAFDAQYLPSFQALVFTIRSCGFRARCALEMSDASETRIEKLYRIIEQSRYGIHDISRTELDAVNGLPRFNMPLELGIFLGAKHFGESDQKTKRCLLFDVDRYRFQKFISDLAGMDIEAHGGDARKIVTKTRNWLATVSRRTRIPSSAAVLASYDRFAKGLPVIASELGFDVTDLAYADFERIVIAWVKENKPSLMVR
jgi:hypothetical protein